MNKRRFIIATMLVAAALSVAVVSCKKETPDEKLNGNEEKTAFCPENITDMNAYLKGFKKQMQESKDGETMSLEEAAWHLSSLANYEYGYINVSYNDIRFDTIYSHVNVANREISVSDMNMVYQEISNRIASFRDEVNLDNHHFRFIGCSINEDGEITISMISTFGRFGLDDHLWYFSDIFEADSICDEYFNLYEHYYASGYGRSELERVLNLLESRPTDPLGRRYYVVMTTIQFYYRDHIDPYTSPSYLNSRLFASFLNNDIHDDMCYYLDSYLGLGHEYCPTGESIISWKVDYDFEQPYEQYHEHLWKAIHHLTVEYGTMYTASQQWDD